MKSENLHFHGAFARFIEVVEENWGRNPEYRNQE